WARPRIPRPRRAAAAVAVDRVLLRADARPAPRNLGALRGVAGPGAGGVLLLWKEAQRGEIARHLQGSRLKPMPPCPEWASPLSLGRNQGSRMTKKVVRAVNERRGLS